MTTDLSNEDRMIITAFADIDRAHSVLGRIRREKLREYKHDIDIAIDRFKRVKEFVEKENDN